MEEELHDLAWSKEWFGWKSECLCFLLLQDHSDTAVHVILTGHYATMNKVIAARMGKQIYIFIIYGQKTIKYKIYSEDQRQMYTGVETTK